MTTEEEYKLDFEEYINIWGNIVMPAYQGRLLFQDQSIANVFLRHPPFPKELLVPGDLESFFYLTSLKVKPDFRESGAGSFLLRRALEFAECLDMPVFNKPLPNGPEPRPTRENLIDFYKKHDFREYDDRFLIWTPSGVIFNLWEEEK